MSVNLQNENGKLTRERQTLRNIIHSQEAEIERLQAENDAYTDKRPIYSVCPQHPQFTAIHKLATTTCYVCESERLQAKLERLVEWLELLDSDEYSSGVWRLDSGGSGLVRINAIVAKIKEDKAND